MRTRDEIEAELHDLGWSVDVLKRTAGGWKGTIKRQGASKLTTGKTELDVLEALLTSAKAHGQEAQPEQKEGQP